MLNGSYKNINFELEKDGSYYCLYEYSPIFKKRCDITFGAAIPKTYHLDYIKNVIDKMLEDICVEEGIE